MFFDGDLRRFDGILMGFSQLGAICDALENGKRWSSDYRSQTKSRYHCYPPTKFDGRDQSAWDLSSEFWLMPTFLSCQWINPHLCGCSWVYQPEVDLTLNPLQTVEAGMFSPHVLVVFFWCNSVCEVMLDDDDKAVDRNYHPGCGFAPEKSEISVHSI